jgi:hypothetical protein
MIMFILVNFNYLKVIPLPILLLLLTQINLNNGVLYDKVYIKLLCQQYILHIPNEDVVICHIWYD